MTQKDNVKQLIGKSLNAYNNKVLQQIDRIEKKNKQQNHKISMLTNEMDNDYLTKSEEGSVISLEHSKEGMVYIDSLEGNTLVNYCTDGAKELTLNGDIDLEGTFVTTTEGVDNGLVDVYCEGNTLVNIFPTNIDLTNPNSNVAENLNYFSRIFPLLQNGKTYTAMFINSPTTIYQVYISACGIPWTNITNNKAVFTVNYESFDSSAPRNLQFMSTGITPIDELTNFKIIILEGDWTDREIPTYFEGMKSVGQDDENGHKIEILSTNSDESKSNKKEILLNEPLRKANDNVKDRFVKINGKLYIERNCKQLTITGNEPNVVWRSDGILGNVYRFWSNNFPNCITLNADGCVFMGSYEGVYQANAINIQISTSKIAEDNVELFVEYLKQNPLTLVIKRDKPIYEPLETNPELLVYNDVAHISNNSTIPCNMKVKNSGYNAIIKPSTLYTVALDTNKSGTIGMNLGGTKVTTTNNVAIITTPATLTDDSLRIYGKGIKGFKVRLLEGDKTNWIPSFFEGMKSCFEDRVQEDGTYKMEILSNNKNLFNENILEKANSNYYEIINKDNRRCLKIERPSLMFRTRILNQLKKNTSYKINFDMLYDRTKGDGLAQGVSIHIVYTDGTTSTCYASNSYNEWLNANITTPLNKTISYIQFSYGTNTPTYIDLDTFIIQENNNLVDYVYHKSNKIQFSSIEPLRGIGEIKDRFVFKDNKLMIERNCCTGSLDGTASIYHCWTNNRNDIVSGYIYYHEHKPEITNIKQHSNLVCTDLPNNRGGHISTVEGFRNTSYFTFSIHKSKLGIEDINAGEENQNIVKRYFTEHPLNFVYQLAEPTYEEIPFELQKIILEGYENGTLFFDTNIPPTSTVTYAGETPIVSAIKSNKSNVISNTNDINDNIIPYLMDMDYRVVCLELATETQGISMARLFGGTYEMLKRDILSKRYSVEEYKYRLDAYLSVNKITEKEYEELGEMLNE